MKKIIKNILITFTIIFTTLNIMTFVYYRVNYNKLLEKEVLPIIDGEISKEIIQSDNDLYNQYKEVYGENAPSTTLAYMQGYFLGQSYILEAELAVLIISAILGVFMGTIISLSETSKMKEGLKAFCIGLILAMVATTYIHFTRNLVGVSFLDGIERTFIDDIVKPYWIYYVLIYLIVYLIKYRICKNKAKELNKELNNKKQYFISKE